MAKSKSCWIAFLVLFLLIGCNLKEKFEQFSKVPPVSPVAETVKTSALIGFASVLTCAHYQGYNVPFTTIDFNNQTKIIQIDLDRHFPFHFHDDVYKDISILSLQVDHDTYILSILLSSSDISSGTFKLYKVHTFPVLIEDGKIIAVYASQDINFGPDHYVEISLSEEEIQFEIERLESTFPSDEYIAIAQNAWFVQVDPNGSWSDFSDDSYVVSGGQQNVAVSTDYEIPDASVVQMAIILMNFSPQCSKNPHSGYVVMQNVEVSQKSETIVGQAFFDFLPDCDGKIKLVAGTGSFIGTSGKKIRLGL
jgi:hypothetical protein